MKSLLGIALLLSSCQAAVASWHPMMKSVVRITNEDDDSMGSGVVTFRARKGMQITTVDHVVEDDENLFIEWFTEESYPRPAGRCRADNVSGVSFENGDHAFITVQNKRAIKSLRAMEFAKRIPSWGFEATYCGCGGGDEPTAHRTRIVGDRSLGRKDEMISTDEPRKGMSGGPLAIRDGGEWKLIGLVSTGAGGRGGFVHFNELKRMDPNLSTAERNREINNLMEGILSDLRSLRSSQKSFQKDEPEQSGRNKDPQQSGPSKRKKKDEPEQSGPELSPEPDPSFGDEPQQSGPSKNREPQQSGPSKKNEEPQQSGPSKKVKDAPKASKRAKKDRSRSKEPEQSGPGEAFESGVKASCDCGKKSRRKKGRNITITIKIES